MRTHGDRDATQGSEAPLEGEAAGGALVLVAVESGMTRTLLWSGLRHSGFAPALVGSAEEARAVLETHGGGAVLLVDGERLVEESRAWRGVAEAAPESALVALRVASGRSFAAAWVEELGCECLDEPLDLERVLAVVQRLARRGRGPLA